jgi:hypothetical protein
VNTSYADFKRHCESLSTEQLLHIAAKSDFVSEAASEMRSELGARRLEIEREKSEIHAGPTAPPPPQHFLLWQHVALRCYLDSRFRRMCVGCLRADVILPPENVSTETRSD